MAKIILVDDGGSTVEIRFDYEKASAERHPLAAHFSRCNCGRVVLYATLIQEGDVPTCQLCSRGLGTERYNKLLSLVNVDRLHAYFAMLDAAAEAESSCGHVIESLHEYFVNGITNDVGILAADIKNGLYNLDDEEWNRICREIVDYV
jgi:hypothetical protein